VAADGEIREIGPDERAFREHVGSGRFLAGVGRGDWPIVDSKTEQEANCFAATLLISVASEAELMQIRTLQEFEHFARRLEWRQGNRLKRRFEFRIRPAPAWRRAGRPRRVRPLQGLGRASGPQSFWPKSPEAFDRSLRPGEPCLRRERKASDRAPVVRQ
jgi:hypothetical protein